MNNELFNEDFESLVASVKQLTDSEKNKLLNVLLESQLPVANEQAFVYSKVSKQNIDFENKWQESLSAEEFKSSIIQHIDSLPWK
ncbi:hypothetical protein [Pedobacter sp.]|uniref:hypothetical protein n=1 Tax=Pedobacter sp. TaxID=1411316 RepID=UPI003BA901B2